MTKLQVHLTTLVLLIVCCTTPLLAQQNSLTGSIVEITFLERKTAAQIAESNRTFFEQFAHPAPIYPVEVFELRFLTRDADRSIVTALATLYIPIVERPTEAPLLAFGSGTTGLGDHCAPNGRVRGWSSYRNNMLAYGSQGIITVFPDYVGFNDPAIPQRYFSKTAEGHLMLDALRAVRAVFAERPELIRGAIQPGPGNVTAGYSQGGHAALAALDMNAAYAPELRLDAGIGFGSTNSVEKLMQEAAYYSASIVYAYQQIYGTTRIDPAEVFQSRWVPTLEENVLSMCVHEFQQYYPFDGKQFYTTEFYDALHEGRLAQEFPQIQQILDENVSGLDGHRKPVLMIQGNQDIIVTNPAQREFAERLRAAGSDVELVEMEGVRHRHTRPAGFARSVAFIFEVFGR